MRGLIGYLLSFIAGLLLPSVITSCKVKGDIEKKEKSYSSAGLTSDSLLVELQRGACFGACPQFVFSVYKSGFAVYQGERHTRRIGEWNAEVNKTQLEEIHSAMAVAKMEQRDTAYINKYLADYPAFFITVCDKLPRKRIYINHDQPPAEITTFVSELERIMESLVWKSKSGVKTDE